jgi:hypothetical protein
MSAVDLDAELLDAFARTEREHGSHEHLAHRLGVPLAAVVLVGGIGKARVVIETGRTYRPAIEGERGVEAHMIGVAAEWPIGYAGEGNVFDVVIWPVTNTRDPRTRVGIADVLGRENLDLARALPHLQPDRPPLFIAETPLAWLQRGATGVCLLDARRSFHLLYGVPAIAFDDERFGAWIWRMLTVERPDLPLFMVRQDATRAVA